MANISSSTMSVFPFVRGGCRLRLRLRLLNLISSQYCRRNRTMATFKVEQTRIPMLISLASKIKTKSKSEKTTLYHLYDLHHDVHNNNNKLQVTFNRRHIDLHLPQLLADHNVISSSQGYLFSVDPTTHNLQATDPLTGSHLPVLHLPPTSTLPGIVGVIRCPDGDRNILWYVFGAPEPQPYYYENRRKGTVSQLVGLSQYDKVIHIDNIRSCFNYRKVILSPSLDIVVILYGREGQGKLAFASSSSSSSSSWISLRSKDIPGSTGSSKESFYDIIFHDGRLHAVHEDGRLAVFNLSSSSSSSISNGYGGNQLVPEFVQLTPQGSPLLLKNNKDGGRRWRRFLVESPDGNDLFFLVGNSDGSTTHGFQVFKLDKSSDYCNWNEVDNIGDIAMFVGFNHSLSLSTQDFPNLMIHLQPNCIYFTGSWDYYNKKQNNNTAGVFSLEDGTIQPLLINTSDGDGDGDGVRNCPSARAMWFVPAAATSI